MSHQVLRRCALSALALVLSAGTVAHAQEVDKGLAPVGGLLAPNSPEITFEIKDVDFGAIMNHEIQHQVFKFKNTGGGPLKILNVTASCGCTLPKLDGEKRDYQPGDTGTITVDFNPKSKMGAAHSSITVTTNDPARPSITLNLSAVVKKLVFTEPALAQIGQVAKGDIKSFEVKVIGRSKDFKCTFASVAPDASAFEAAIVGEPTEIDYQGEKLIAQTVKVAIKKDTKVGYYNHVVNVRTNDEREPVASFSVFANVMGDLEANPAAVSLGMLEAGKPYSGEFKIYTKSRVPFKLTGTEKLFPDVKGDFKATFEPATAPSLPSYGPDGKPITRVEAKPGDGPNCYLVKFSGTAPETEGPFTGQIKILSDVQLEDAMSVSFHANVRRQVVRPSAPKPAVTAPVGTPAATPAVAPGTTPTPASTPAAVPAPDKK
ncbi:MAG: DUF1573 domain-containing protein [Planctomycetes bacterium]|nr:DUF1573 domain-containing protein [Planctomycetota bacterium]